MSQYIATRFSDFQALTKEIEKSTVGRTADLSYCKIHFGSDSTVVESNRVGDTRLVSFVNPLEAAEHILRRWW